MHDSLPRLHVEVAQRGRGALAAATSFRPHLIVLDVMLPDLDGFEIQRRLAADRLRVPILFLTARGETEAKVHGLTMGADDYVTKPFSLEELIARVRAVLRRTRLTERRVGRLAYADLVLDEEAMRVSRAGEPIQLSPTEFKLLRCLLLNPERVLSKDRILDRVWQYDFDGKSGVVENYISCLRKKVDTVEPALIHTVRGFGYVPRTESRKRCPAATRSTRPADESACRSCNGVRGTLDPHTADALPALVPAQRDRRP